MVLIKRLVNWDKIALKQLGEACNYIKRDSLKNAQKVRKDIFTCTSALAQHPEKYPLDKYRRNNDSTFRAFEKHHLPVAYCILPTEIKIISVRNSSMEPVNINYQSLHKKFPTFLFVLDHLNHPKKSTNYFGVICNWQTYLSAIINAKFV